MNFTEPIFGLFVLLVFAGLAVVRRKQIAIWMIIAASTVFYGWWNVSFLLLLAMAALADFFLAQWIGGCNRPAGRKALLVVSICWNLGLLMYFKYINFFVDVVNQLGATVHLRLPHLDHHNIVLPIGISFFVFETLSYSIDVYRGDFKPIKKLSHFLMFISFFPHLVAGPIVRGRDFLPQVEGDFLSKRDWSGLFFVLFGLAKKMLIADPLGQLVVDPVFAAPSGYGKVDLIFAVYCYSFQIFLDFSGYTDIAIGLARIMGFDLGLNFDAPYIARSFGEFWRRWHISLSTWFRDYLFVPLGGSRVRPMRIYANLLVVFVVSGLWHGADWRFVVWGGLNGLFLMTETFVRRSFRTENRPLQAPWSVAGVFRALLVFNAISAAWVFFRAENWTRANEIFRLIGTASTKSMALATGLPLYLLALAVVLHLAIEPFKEKVARTFDRSHVLLRAGAVLLVGALLFDQSLQRIGHKAFIYFQF